MTLKKNKNVGTKRKKREKEKNLLQLREENRGEKSKQKI